VLQGLAGAKGVETKQNLHKTSPPNSSFLALQFQGSLFWIFFTSLEATLGGSMKYQTHVFIEKIKREIHLRQNTTLKGDHKM
tara:strand:- start:663 stop:908 length:246 start_codon:yes stop_codon:yes gene_type:complete